MGKGYELETLETAEVDDPMSLALMADTETLLPAPAEEEELFVPFDGIDEFAVY